MRKAFIYICALALVCVFVSAKPERRRVVYSSDLDCENCEKKVMENIAFEKGVKDISVNLDNATVSIIFDETKTDTLKLAKAIRRLGYSAKVIDFE